MPFIQLGTFLVVVVVSSSDYWLQQFDMSVGYSHFLIRKVASAGLASFFREIHVIGEENVPLDGPVVLYERHILHICPLLILFAQGAALTTT